MKGRSKREKCEEKRRKIKDKGEIEVKKDKKTGNARDENEAKKMHKKQLLTCLSQPILYQN